MSLRTRGLGRGLEALISPNSGHGGPAPRALVGPAVPVGRDAEPDGLAPAADAQLVGELRQVSLDAIEPNPRQPRRDFDEGSLEELAASIKEVGLLQPVVVRETTSGRYELVMGERRCRAARLAGLDDVPAIVRRTTDDAMLRDALLENVHRAQLNPLEEGAAYRQLLDDFACTHEELATRLGRSRSHLTNTMRLLGLPPAVQRRVAAGVLSAGHARALLALPDPERQEQLAGRIVAEGLSVRAVEELVALEEGAPARRPAPRAVRQQPPQLEEVAGRLADRLETKVKVELGRNKGRITVEFGSLEDLERIAAAMAPLPPSWA